MPTFEVYHVDNEGLRDSMFLNNASVEKILEFVSSHVYEHVADVVSEDLEDVFRLTNHIDDSWLNNEGVMAFNIKSRSTSVGDVVYNCQAEKHYICMPFGFRELGGRCGFNPSKIISKFVDDPI